jgi:hypothetical protein
MQKDHINKEPGYILGSSLSDDVDAILANIRLIASHYAADVRSGMDLLTLLRSLLPARRSGSLDLHSLYSSFLEGNSELSLPQISEHVQCVPLLLARL